MVASNFDTCLKYVLKDEGGNEDDPRDHGGRTSRGITQREYDHWCSLEGKPQGDVWKASNDDIASIYKDQYWSPYCDDLPAGVDYLFFDISVNAGRTQAVRQFQKALNVNVDGMMGIVTKNAIAQQATPDAGDLIKRISEARRAFYRALKQFPIYGKGWLNRVNHAEKGALALSTGTKYNKTSVPSVKADPTPTSTTVSPEASGATTVATGGLMETLNSFKDSLANYADTLQWIKYVLVGVAVFSLGYSVYGFYVRSKANRAM